MLSPFSQRTCALDPNCISGQVRPLNDERRFFRRLLTKLLFLLCSAVLALQPVTVLAQRKNQLTRNATVTVNFKPGQPANRFAPAQALGAGVDGHGKGQTESQLSPRNVEKMLSAGLKPLTYRLRTELAGEAWHWNPRGSWSDAANRQGYWISDSEPREPIRVSYGYRLPRRGNTIDQANDDGYSRIDDGDDQTFWKSNPYLDEHFTGENNSINPQWVMIDLGARKQINAMRILWSEPYATDFSIEYGEFVGEADLSQRLPTEWHAFPGGKFTNARGGDSLIHLSRRPLMVRYVRIRLNQSSETGPKNSTDIRDRLGYAIREIHLGLLNRRVGLQDVIRHAATKNGQTVVYVSSTDPWHREGDRDNETEQPGFDFIFNSGLTNGRPMLLPVPVLFDTPENGAAEIKYLKTRGYPVERVELGEEPDGQFVTPEHFGSLYLQFEKAIHNINPALQLGGPSLQDIEQTGVPGRIEFGKAGWMGSFLQYLKAHGKLKEFTFFSFEWYPFGDDCSRKQLLRATTMLNDALAELERGGLAHDIPWIITEYGYSAFGARAEIDIDGALLNADSVARFLTLGGEQAYLYGYEPGEIIEEQACSSGNNMLFFRDSQGHITKPTATYWGARLLTQEWLQPGDGVHEIYPATSNERNADGEELISAYAVHRPDGLWSLLLINKDLRRSFQTNVVFRMPPSGGTGGLGGPLDVFQYSSKQYVLGGPASNPYPVRADDPDHKVVQASRSRLTQISLPPYSLTVIRGELSPLWIR